MFMKLFASYVITTLWYNRNLMQYIIKSIMT